jgi:hypothetical protein
MEGTIIKPDQSSGHLLSLLSTLLQSETKASSSTLASCYMGSIRTSAKQHRMMTIILIPRGRINKRLSLYHEEFLTMWWSAHHHLFPLAALVSMVWRRSHVTWYPISRVSAERNAKPFDKNHKLKTVLISRSSKATTLIESFLTSIRNGINSKCPGNRQ